MAPIHRAFAALWPEPELVDLLDSGLTIDRERSADLTGSLSDRFVAFARYAHTIGGDGILATCSAFGPAIEAADTALPIPVIKPNEAMFTAALGHGSRIAMLATFAPSVPSMTDEFDRIRGSAPPLHTVVVDRAIDALRRGDEATHNQLIAECATELHDYDAILLAHFSTSQAATAVRSVVDAPVFTAPESAVLALRAAMSESI
jgi:Asp/Glu/hydantoin racemase